MGPDASDHAHRRPADDPDDPRAASRGPRRARRAGRDRRGRWPRLDRPLGRPGDRRVGRRRRPRRADHLPGRVRLRRPAVQPAVPAGAAGVHRRSRARVRPGDRRPRRRPRRRRGFNIAVSGAVRDRRRSRVRRRRRRTSPPTCPRRSRSRWPRSSSRRVAASPAFTLLAAGLVATARHGRRVGLDPCVDADPVADPLRRLGDLDRGSRGARRRPRGSVRRRHPGPARGSVESDRAAGLRVPSAPSGLPR